VATTRPDDSIMQMEQFSKFENMRRFEREKRALQKKHIYEEYDRQVHPMKNRKTAKTNWTKQYEKGTLDEEEF
jgi:hypothetical protein